MRCIIANTEYNNILIDIFISGNILYLFEKFTNFISKEYIIKNIRPRDLILNDYSFKDRCKRRFHYYTFGQFESRFTTYKLFKEY